jgi:hypothetical protein
MKLKLGVILAFVALSATLSACLITSGSAVRSTVTLQDGDRQVSQTLYSSCTAIASAGSRSVQIITVGWRHWFNRPDGSILILGDQQPCRPAPARRRRSFVAAFGANVGPDTSWLFDNATRPSRADLYDTSSLGDGARFNLVSAETAPALHLPTGNLNAAFPWIDSLASGTSAAAPNFAAPVRYSFIARPGAMTGWVVQAYAIEGPVRCADPSAPIVSLEDDNACTRLRPCPSDRDAACLQSLGNLRLTPSADFQQLVIADFHPEPAYIATLYTATGLGSVQSKLQEGWSPSICFQGVCVMNGHLRYFRLDLYLPQSNEVLRVTQTSTAVGPTQFRNASFS